MFCLPYTVENLHKGDYKAVHILKENLGLDAKASLVEC